MDNANFDNLGATTGKPTYVTYRKINIDVTAANQSAVNKQYILDADIETVTGMSFSCDSLESEARIYDLTSGLRISGSEILPDDFEARLLATSLTVPPADRYLPFNQAKGSGKVEVKVIDRNSLGTGSFPYKVTVVLRCLATSGKA